MILLNLSLQVYIIIYLLNNIDALFNKSKKESETYFQQPFFF